MADTDKKFLDEDGVNQFAEETKKYVDNHADNTDIHVTTDDKANWNAKQSALTAEQLAAVNSGINATAKGNYDAHVANADIHVTAADKANWNGKQDALTSQQIANINDVVNKADASDLTAHTNNADIHVTADDKANWNAKANDADVVHKSGNETVAGVKTFTSNIVIDGSGNQYQSYASDYVKGIAPSSIIYQGVRFYDDQKVSTVGNHITGAFEIQYNTDGYNKAYVGCRNYAGTTQHNYNVGLRVPNDLTRSIDFYPSADNKINLGASSYKWADVQTYLLNGKTPAYADDLANKADKSELSDYYPISGGALTGNIIERNTDSDHLGISGAYWGHGAYLWLSGQNSGYAGSWYLSARDTEKSCDLVGSPSGVLSWGGKLVATEDDLANYLPLSGGTMTATIKTYTSLGGPAIRHISPIDGMLGGELWLFDRNTDYHGGALLRCHSEDGVSSKDFLVQADGVCKWDGKNVDVIEEQGDGYIRYSNGLQMCWGTFTTATQVMPVTFAKPFLSSIYAITALCARSSAVSVSGNRTAAGIDLSTDIVDGVGRRLDYIVIGRWK